MLSDIKRNIVNWYPFKQNATVLEIGVEIGEVTNELCLKNEKVISIKIQKDATEYNYNKENLEVFCGKLENINIEEKFDYVTLIGTLDYAEEILQTENAAKILLEYAKSHLKEDGKILIACDNKLGLDKTTILNKREYKFTRNTLNSIFEDVNFKNIKYYYVLPNYQSPNVIYTDDFLPNEENISRNFTLYSDNEIILFEQIKKYKELIREDKELFKCFANSFFIEISPNKKIKNDIKFVSFSNIRKSEYRIKTTINSEFVYKQAVNEKSKQHIENIKKNIDIMKKSNIKTIDSYDNEKIISKFQENANTLDKIVLEKFQNNKVLEGIDEIKKFMNFIIENFEKAEEGPNIFKKYDIVCSKDSIENMHFIKNGLWDLIFTNCFYINDEYYFYDQEWYEENVPVEFIMYRAILYCTSLNQYISAEELYSSLGIEVQALNLFRKLDDILQKDIRDNDVWNVHCNQKTIEKVFSEDKIRKELLRKQIDESKAQKIELQNIIAQLNEQIRLKDEEIRQKQDTINGIYNSGTWKMTEPLRKIRKIIKKKKDNFKD